MQFIRTNHVDNQSENSKLIELIRVTITLIVLLVAVAFTLTNQSVFPNSNGYLLVFSGVCVYLLFSIGSNNLASLVGPAVGKTAFSFPLIVILAFVFEVSGALLTGGQVTTTIHDNILKPTLIGQNTKDFVNVMLTTLLGAAIWLHFATFTKVPVSTVHAMIGGLLGSGIALAGVDAVNWSVTGIIASSWLLSPVIGALLSAIFFSVIHFSILKKEDKLSAAGIWVPRYLALLVWAFMTYLFNTEQNRLWSRVTGMLSSGDMADKVNLWSDWLISNAVSLSIAGLLLVCFTRLIRIKKYHLENTLESVNELFAWPLIVAIALLCFAHGANDLASIIAPLIAVFDGLMLNEVNFIPDIPIWSLVVAAIMVVCGFALYGSEMSRAIGDNFILLDRINAFAIFIGVAFTAMLTSFLGLPVSLIHIIIGAVIGTGLFQEWVLNSRLGVSNIENERVVYQQQKQLLREMKHELKTLLVKTDKQINDFMLIDDLLSRIERDKTILKQAKKALKQDTKIIYVNRENLRKIITAWLITIPATAVLSHLLFITLL